jgi:nucleoside-diphosphate-sugar epimerase
MANYLVLGGDGFIGKFLVNHLVARGNYVESIDFNSDAAQDLRVLKISNLTEFDACFFLAWNVGGSKFLTEPSTWQAQFADNVALIHNIFPQLIRTSIPFLFVSSQLAGADESPYSLTKKLAEKYII